MGNKDIDHKSKQKNVTLKEVQKYMKEIPLEDIERYWDKTKNTKGENQNEEKRINYFSNGCSMYDWMWIQTSKY